MFIQKAPSIKDIYKHIFNNENKLNKTDRVHYTEHAPLCTCFTYNGQFGMDPAFFLQKLSFYRF